MKKVLLALACLIVLCFPRMGRGDELFGEFQRLPDQVERGFSVGFDFGLLFFTGEARTAKNPGFQLTFTTGYDLFKYLSLEGVYSIGINEASAGDFVLQGGVNTILLNLAAKAQYPLGRFYPFLEVGPGIHYSDPEFVPGQNNKINILIGGGIEYYTYLRHFSLYAKTSYYYILDVPVDTINIGAGLKYTF
ncbi:MAG TPA: adventurous gliding motility protein CglE [Bdellovibrionota bacterium]|nr:adventurous gliding motility protein CglE [Bdellovibrionota bacterium]